LSDAAADVIVQRGNPGDEDSVKSLFAICGVGIILGLAPPDVVSAQTTRHESPSFKQCLAKSGGITVNVHDCDAAEYGRIDGELNATYRALTAKLDPKRRTTLVKAQREWLAWRKLECDYDASAEEDGSDYPLLIDSCFINMTQDRINTLSTYLKVEAEFGQ
jgi:uncharacterized protein YecT (DUF1311 family)